MLTFGAAVLGCALAAGSVANRPRAGERVDLSRFAAFERAETGLVWSWDLRREVRAVQFAASAEQAASVRLAWWASQWPNNGAGGWMKLDDPWNGEWVHVETRPVETGDGLYELRFPPLTRDEWPGALVHADQYPEKKYPEYRQTLKLRLTGEGALAVDPGAVRITGSSTWAEGAFRIELRAGQAASPGGRVEVQNGVLLGMETLSGAGIEVDGAAWRCPDQALPPAETHAFRVETLYAQTPVRHRTDRTRITVRLGAAPDATGFSFVPQDVYEHGALRLPDFGALVTPADSNLTMANDPGADPDRFWSRPVRARLAHRGEMTRERAMGNIPRLRPRQWIHLGAPAARQEVSIGPNGDWSMWNQALRLDMGEASKRIPYRRHDENFLAITCDAILDTRESPAFDGGDREDAVRYLEDEWLPVVHAAWGTGPLRYRHQLIATTLTQDYGGIEERTGDETVVLLTKLEIENPTDAPQQAVVNLRVDDAAPMAVGAKGVVRIEPRPEDFQPPEGLTPVRLCISMDAPAGGGADGWSYLRGEDGQPGHLNWQADIGPGATRAVYFKAPYVELLDDAEVDRLLAVRFDAEKGRVCGYWRDRVTHGMDLSLPDKALEAFYKASLWHNMVTSDRDPQTGLYMQGVGTMYYGVYANETVMIARSMDLRGEHAEAERYLEPMLHYQGDMALKGRFASQEGAFHSAGPYTWGEYAMNHGFVLWGVAEHYLLTKDRAYLERVAPKLVAGCEFLIRERATQMVEENGRRAPYYGLAPACSLEDVLEFQYWFATNAYYALGMQAAADALADIGHPEAKRLQEAAAAYAEDIEQSAREAATQSAVVPLRDGTFIPYVPSRVHQWEHLTEGWIREALYCGLHLGSAGIVPYDDPLMTWMLDELEDNVIFSWQSGYNLEDYEETWFKKGGVTLQPCLLDMPSAYIARDEIPAALRAFWNTYAMSIYPDATCFAEWVREFGRPGGPLYKTSDESRFVIWLRQLLVWEDHPAWDGSALWLARGAPRAWLGDGERIEVRNAPVFTGAVSYVIESHVDRGVIEAEVELHGPEARGAVYLRLRHPNGPATPERVLVNGMPLDPARIEGEDILLKRPDDAAGASYSVRALYDRP